MRVIAGSAKGRELIAPKGMHTRPTLAKVKEAMFGMVQFDIPGASVLDLFSGSGALGIEALSRGAERAVFCDADRQAASVIKSNLKRLGFEGLAEVSFCDSIALLQTLAERGQRFDLVLLDPPYETPLASSALARLAELGLLNEGAILLCEYSPSNPPAFEGLPYTAKKPKKYGDTCVVYLTYNSEEQS